MPEKFFSRNSRIKFASDLPVIFPACIKADSIQAAMTYAITERGLNMTVNIVEKDEVFTTDAEIMIGLERLTLNKFMS
jgi:hypothetical protein